MILVYTLVEVIMSYFRIIMLKDNFDKIVQIFL